MCWHEAAAWLHCCVDRDSCACRGRGDNRETLGEAILAALKKGFAGVNDCTATVSLTVKGPQMSINGMRMTLYYKKPNKIHVEAEQGMAMFPRGDFFGNPIQELANGARAVYVKSERKLGVDCHVLKLTRTNAGPDAPAMTVWVDKKHMVAVAVESTGTAALKSSWRYETIGGKYYLPVEMIAELRPPGGPNAGKPVKSTIKFSNYKVNKGISDKIFESKPPAKDSGWHPRRRYRK